MNKGRPKNKEIRKETANEEMRKAVVFVQHLKDHQEVKNALKHAGIPCCKICNKTINQIYDEELKKKFSEVKSKC